MALAPFVEREIMIIQPRALSRQAAPRLTAWIILSQFSVLSAMN
jgi:hypothetical protein